MAENASFIVGISKVKQSTFIESKDQSTQSR